MQRAQAHEHSVNNPGSSQQSPVILNVLRPMTLMFEVGITMSILLSKELQNSDATLKTDHVIVLSPRQIGVFWYPVLLG